MVDDAVAPFEDLLAAEDLAWMRDQLGCLLEDDPHARDALAGARPRVVDDSGERIKPDIPGVEHTALLGALPEDETG